MDSLHCWGRCGLSWLLNHSFGWQVVVSHSFIHLNLFQRAWCVAELAEAHRLGMAQTLFLRNKATLLTRQGTLEALQVENMRASRPEDVQQILSKIPNKTMFNQKLQELIFDGQVGLLAAWRKADVLQQMEDLSHLLKWARASASVDNGALIWRRWVAPAAGTN